MTLLDKKVVMTVDNVQKLVRGELATGNGEYKDTKVGITVSTDMG